MYPDFSTDSAEVMELTLEGNRLIARELADLAHGMLHRVSLALNDMFHATGRRRRLPPV